MKTLLFLTLKMEPLSVSKLGWVSFKDTGFLSVIGKTISLYYTGVFHLLGITLARVFSKMKGMKWMFILWKWLKKTVSFCGFAKNNYDFSGQISFEVDSCGLTDPEWWNTEHSAEIYKDKMYVFGQRTQDDREKLTLKTFDLSKKHIGEKLF